MSMEFYLLSLTFQPLREKKQVQLKIEFREGSPSSQFPVSVRDIQSGKPGEVLSHLSLEYANDLLTQLQDSINALKAD